jgi:alanyl-tRNA synthetase
MFLDFFKARGHEIVPSSKVVPFDDPTLLFTNAGMNQFKNIFLGLENSDFTRAASVQKCIRASGKHNDLEDVGKDGIHHTFFEMLGNWSFGDYYKKEAIQWAWEFVTEKMGLAEENLWASVYKDDREAWDIWINTIGVEPTRLVKLGDIERGDEENFWSMGETGPCGPCSEILYDFNPSKGKNFFRASDEGEILELWNLVFMEFNREADGNLRPLPKKNIDTGMGLERALAILGGVTSNYKTDLFIPIMVKLEDLSGVSARNSSIMVSCRVIADHIRSLVFAIADGAVPSNEGRGYVLRRILRRAVRHGKLLGFEEPFLHTLVDTLVDTMGDPYIELVEKKQTIASIILSEEELFLRTLDRGLEEFEKTVSQLRKRENPVFPGTEAFILHDTFGFPLDLTQIMAEEKNMTVDTEGFKKEMQKQRMRAQKGSRFKTESEAVMGEWVIFGDDQATNFTGYSSLKQTSMRLVKYRASGDEVQLVFDRTPFYAETGGQVGDTGIIRGKGLRIRIKDVKKTGDIHLHIGVLEKGEISDTVYTGTVDAERRRRIMANHTATHLLHYALRKVLGFHVTQSGSLVAPDRLRFDFNHYNPLTEKEQDEIEGLVNEAVLQNLPVTVYSDVPLEEARSMGALALFGEKYGKTVRVIQVDGLSAELCGGTHAERTGDIGFFKLIKESSISSGVRRIEAVTFKDSYLLIKKNEGILRQATNLLETSPEGIPEKIRNLLTRLQDLEKKLKADRRKSFDSFFETRGQSTKAGKYTLLSMKLTDHTQDELREISDRAKSGLKKGVVFISSTRDNRVSIVLSATEDAVKCGIHSGNLLKAALEGTAGSGGGRPHLAQGGGIEPDRLDEVIKRLKMILQEE